MVCFSTGPPGVHDDNLWVFVFVSVLLLDIVAVLILVLVMVLCSTGYPGSVLDGVSSYWSWNQSFWWCSSVHPLCLILIIVTIMALDMVLVCVLPYLALS